MLGLQRQKFIVGNWKMHKTIGEAKAFVQALIPITKETPLTIGLAVPYTMIAAAAESAKNTRIYIGAQNVSDAAEGAFTGEISIQMIKDAGGSFVIVGHSERRQFFHEDNVWINRKVKRIVSEGLRAIVCIGESLNDRKSGSAKEVLLRQMNESLSDITIKQLENIVIAYEPIWAIGTNQTATPQIAQEIHKFCRDIIKDKWGHLASERMVIQYGGSVKPDNVKALLSESDIDGFLVGGASLTFDSFSKIIEYARE